MEQFLASVAQTLRNLGFTDAVASDDSVSVRGVMFYARRYRNRVSFHFCGQVYRTGNVQQAVLALISRLAYELRVKEQREVLEQREKILEAFNASIKEHGMKITQLPETYILSVVGELESLKTVAKQIANAQDIVFASLESRLAAFTSEGGFSLN